jgi:hypothetical protein
MAGRVIPHNDLCRLIHRIFAFTLPIRDNLSPERPRLGEELDCIEDLSKIKENEYPDLFQIFIKWMGVRIFVKDQRE